MKNKFILLSLTVICISLLTTVTQAKAQDSSNLKDITGYKVDFTKEFSRFYDLKVYRITQSFNEMLFCFKIKKKDHNMSNTKIILIEIRDSKDLIAKVRVETSLLFYKTRPNEYEDMYVDLDYIGPVKNISFSITED